MFQEISVNDIFMSKTKLNYIILFDKHRESGTVYMCEIECVWTSVNFWCWSEFYPVLINFRYSK